MYKSLFERIKNYSSNPVNEFKKINSFINNTEIDYMIKLSTLLEDAFVYCKDLRRIYPDYKDCIWQNCSSLFKYDVLPNDSYNSLIGEDTKELLLNEFLTYCQIVLTMVNYIINKQSEILSKHFITSLNAEIINQLVEMIESSLKCFNYKHYIKKDFLNVELAMDNPVAEAIAAESKIDISDAIMGYLSNRDVKTKENYLHTFIDLIEPLFKTYSDQAIIKKIREYSQLIRHPEVKKDDPQYKWFFVNKKKHLDNLFSLCLFVQQYSISKNIIKEFEDNKNYNK